MRSLLGRFHRPMSRGAMGDMLTMNSLGDGSTLSLDFTTGVLDSRLTFTRSTTATYINSSGYVTSAAINAPRFDYSPTNIGEPRGLLIEGQTANLCTYSNGFNDGAWTKDGASTGGLDPTVDASYLATGPDGASTVTRIVFNKTNGAFSRIRRAISVSNGAYIMSIWMKANTAAGAPSSQAVVLRMGSSAGVDCAVTTTWQRFTHTFTVGDGSAEFQIMLWDNVNGPAETADVLVYGAQLEAGTAGTGASSYIPTGASQVTRNADDCYVSGSNFTSWFNSTQGTLLVTARSGGIYYDTSAYDFAAVLTQSGTGTDHIGCAQWSSGLFGVVRANNTYNLNYTSLGSLTAPYKAAIAYAVSDFAAVANNGTITTGTGSLPLSINRMRIGGSRSGSAAAGFSGTIANIKFFPTRLPNAQLQTLTTP